MANVLILKVFSVRYGDFEFSLMANLQQLLKCEKLPMHFFAIIEKEDLDLMQK